MIIIKIKNVKNNKILYSNNDRSDIPANTAYLSLHKII